jgi:hypothetical protein
MSQSGTLPTNEFWSQVLGSCERSAYHLEMRDSYAVSYEDPMFAAWRAGHRDDPADRDSWWRPWLSLVAETTGRGVPHEEYRPVCSGVSTRRSPA